MSANPYLMSDKLHTLDSRQAAVIIVTTVMFLSASVLWVSCLGLLFQQTAVTVPATPVSTSVSPAVGKPESVKQELTFTVHQYNPPGSVDGKGIYQEILSRCGNAGRANLSSQARGWSKTTWAHEATHELNARIRFGHESEYPGITNALYIGQGRVVMLPNPRVNLSTVASYVPITRRRTTYFQTYLVQARHDHEHSPTYVLDEFNAYVNEMQYDVESGTRDSGGYDGAEALGYFSILLVQAVREHDPHYPQLKELEAFVAWEIDRACSLQQQHGKRN